MVPNLAARTSWCQPYDGPVPTGRLPALLAASHPEPAALVTGLTALLCLAAGRRWDVLLVVAAVACGQLGVGWSNDYLDRDLDRAQGRLDKPLALAVTAAATTVATPTVSGQAGAAPAAATPLPPTTVRTAALAALAAAVPLSLAAGVGFAAAHLLAVGLALAYNLRLKVVPLSVVPYAAAFGLLPVAITLGLPSPRWPHGWAVAASALIGAGGHFTQALPDIPADRRLGIRGLPQLVGQRASAMAAAALLLAASLVIAFGPGRPPGVVQVAGVAVATALAAGIVAAALAERPRLAFRLTLGTAAVAVLVFVAGGGQL
jgi:4-hydroxybenzoate polyprenyltransferase